MKNKSNQTTIRVHRNLIAELEDFRLLAVKQATKTKDPNAAASIAFWKHASNEALISLALNYAKVYLNNP